MGVVGDRDGRTTGPLLPTQLEALGAVGGLVGFGAERGVDEGSAGELVGDGDAVTGVDVAKHVQAGADGAEAEQQLKAADVARGFAAPGRGEVAMTVGRAVGDDDIGLFGNLSPFRAEGGATIPHEMPIVEGGGVRGAKEAEAFDVDDVVDEEVDAVGGEGGAEGGGILFDGSIMVSSRDQLVGMRQTAQPGGEIVGFLVTAVSAEVAGVNENVALRDRVRESAMQAVGIAEEDEGEGGGGHQQREDVRLRWTGQRSTCAFERGGDFLLDDTERIERGEGVGHGRDLVGGGVPVHGAVAAGGGIAGEDVCAGVAFVEMPKLIGEMDETMRLHHRGDG